MQKLNGIAGVAFGLLAVSASAEIVTGSFSEDVLTNGRLLGIPVEIVSTGWSHGGMDFHDIGFEHTTIHELGAVSLMYSENDDSRVFEEGQTVSTTGEWATSGYVQWGRSEYDGYYGKTYYSGYAGEIGDTLYLGFSFDRPVGDDGVTVRNAGFLQLYKYGRAHYEVIGYAYETTADASIQTFDLVPAPGTASLFGLGMVAAGRRRRSSQR